MKTEEQLFNDWWEKSFFDHEDVILKGVALTAWMAGRRSIKDSDLKQIVKWKNSYLEYSNRKPKQ